jgi:protein-tyrosine phosphatase
VDDGAADLDESRSGIETLLANGVTAIITTPHISASLGNRGGLDAYLERIELAFADLKSLAANEYPRLRLERGFEVMLDIPHPRLDNPALRLAGTTFALVEFPYMNIPPNSAFALRELRQAGWNPIIAHPERYSNMEPGLGVMEEWRDAGAHVQIKSGSLMGSYGPRAKRLAWSILESGAADYLCSDYHSRGRCTFAAAVAELKRRGYASQLDTLKTNGFRILDGEMPLAVEPLTAKPKSAWKKVFPWA